MELTIEESFAILRKRLNILNYIPTGNLVKEDAENYRLVWSAWDTFTKKWLSQANLNQFGSPKYEDK